MITTHPRNPKQLIHSFQDTQKRFLEKEASINKKSIFLKGFSQKSLKKLEVNFVRRSY